MTSDICKERKNKLEKTKDYRKLKNKCESHSNRKIVCRQCEMFLWRTATKTKCQLNISLKTLIVGHSFSGKTYLIMENLKHNLKRDFFIITRSL